MTKEIKQQTGRYRGLTRTIVLFSIVAGLAGCSSEGPERIPVHVSTGQVLLDGKPLSGALVVLHPENSTDQRLLPARAQSDADGRFRLTTYDNGDGAAEGAFAVTVEYYPAQKIGDSFVPGPNVLPPKYSNPQTSDVKVRIAAGENQLDPINLKMR